MILDFDNDTSSYVVYETQRVIDNHIPSQPTSPSRYGWIFDYWMLNNEEVNISRSIHNHTVYYSHWTRDIMKVTLDANGGSSASEIEVICGESINEPVATRTGNHLDGWYLNNEKVSFPLVVNDDITLIAYWNVIVTFTNNDTTYSSSTIRSGTTVSQPNNPSRTGYDFNYWMLDNQQFNFSNEISQDTTLVAKYAATPYSISYTLNSGTNNSNNKSIYTIEDTPFSLYQPTRTCYVFAGWTGSNGSTKQKSVTVASNTYGDLSYTANWTLNSDTSKHNLNSSYSYNSSNHYKTCRNCGNAFNSSSHSFSSSVISSASCGVSGTRRYTCSTCGYYYNETIPALSHSYYWVSTSTWHRKKCSNCGAYGGQEESHVEDSYLYKTESYHYTRCSVCGSMVNSWNHTPDGTLYRDKNYHWYVCSECGYVYNKGQHSYQLMAGTFYACNVCLLPRDY